MALIMLIEDNVQNARLVEKLLKKAKHQVIVSPTGEEGLEKAFENRPDVILIDLGLPDIDGQTVIALMRQQASLQGVPLIAFTAWPESSAHNMAKAYGCDGVIIKPINTRALVGQIEAFLPKPAAPDAPAVPAPTNAD
jgi:DNA-binding response OmpR family regulator